jgi:hypothetical protein
MSSSKTTSTLTALGELTKNRTHRFFHESLATGDFSKGYLRSWRSASEVDFKAESWAECLMTLNYIGEDRTPPELFREVNDQYQLLFESRNVKAMVMGEFRWENIRFQAAGLAMSLAFEQGHPRGFSISEILTAAADEAIRAPVTRSPINADFVQGAMQRLGAQWKPRSAKEVWDLEFNCGVVAGAPENRFHLDVQEACVTAIGHVGMAYALATSEENPSEALYMSNPCDPPRPFSLDIPIPALHKALLLCMQADRYKDYANPRVNRKGACLGGAFNAFMKFSAPAKDGATAKQRCAGLPDFAELKCWKALLHFDPFINNPNELKKALAEDRYGARSIVYCALDFGSPWFWFSVHGTPLTRHGYGICPMEIVPVDKLVDWNILSLFAGYLLTYWSINPGHVFARVVDEPPAAAGATRDHPVLSAVLFATAFVAVYSIGRRTMRARAAAL